MKIINVSESTQEWKWLENDFKDSNLEWLNYSCHAFPRLKSLPKDETVTRAIAAFQAARKAKLNKSVIVSHGHKMAFFAAGSAKMMCPEVPMLAFTFSFTDLPQGKKRSLMSKAFTQPKKFVCYTSLERELYSNYFDIPIDSIDMLHWNVHAPKLDAYQKPVETSRYFCALGSQGRDYKPLFAAMKKLPNIKLVVVAAPECVKDLDIPENVKVHTKIPLEQAHNILANSEFMVLPLRDTKVPCGHMTIVSSMFFKKTILVTNAESVTDYIENDKTGLYFEHNNENDLMKKIENLWEDSAKTIAMNESAFSFANQYCTERTAVNYFSNFLKQYT